jgi:hypothetical protein
LAILMLLLLLLFLLFLLFLLLLVNAVPSPGCYHTWVEWQVTKLSLYCQARTTGRPWVNCWLQHTPFSHLSDF